MKITVIHGQSHRGVTYKMAKQLRWMGVPKVYRMGVVSFAGPGEQLKPKKVIEIEQKAKK